MFTKIYVKEAHVLLLAYIDITFFLKKVYDSIQSLVKKWTTTLSEMKRDVEMENIYRMCDYLKKNSMSRCPFVNFK